MTSQISLRANAMAVLLFVVGGCGELAADEGRSYPFEVREAAGIRRRNDVITVRSAVPEIVGHTGGYRISHADKPVPAQFRRVEWPGEPPQLVVDFVGHFQPFEARRYVLRLIDEPASGEPASGLQLAETGESYRIDSGGLVFWTIRKDLRGLLDFSWKETAYIADDSSGMFFTGDDGATHQLAERRPTRVAVERSGTLATSLRFDYEDWPPGAHSRVRLEFVRTKSWIRGEWTIDGDSPAARSIGGGLNLRLDGPEALLDFGAGDFVYATVTSQQAARLEAGPRTGNSVPWHVLHGAADALEPICVAPQHVPTPEVHGWAHVMDDQRCTALAIGDFGEATADAIAADGKGQLTWTRTFAPGAPPSDRPQRLEFWLHFVTMPVHIGARTSPRSMQEPEEVRWITE